MNQFNEEDKLQVIETSKSFKDQEVAKESLKALDSKGLVDYKGGTQAEIKEKVIRPFTYHCLERLQQVFEKTGEEKIGKNRLDDMIKHEIALTVKENGVDRINDNEIILLELGAKTSLKETLEQEYSSAENLVEDLPDEENDKFFPEIGVEPE